MRKDGVLTYLYGDRGPFGRGSTILTTDGNGTVANRQGYTAYGEKSNGDDLLTDHNFTGQKLDATGLLYYQARYYDPAVGQFLSPDTLVPDATLVSDYNRYMMVRGNPLRFSDPTGHYSNDEIMQHFGCGSWDCVESQFSEGGALEGAWGWLNVLQEAKDGDTVTSTMLAQIEGQAGSVYSSLSGTFLFSNNRISVKLQTFVGADVSQSTLEGILDGDAFAQFARNGDYGLYGIESGIIYGRDVKAACYTAGQCAIQTLDAISTGSATIAAICLGSVVGAPCATIALQFGLYAGVAGTTITALSMKDGMHEDASALDVGVGIFTTTAGGLYGPAGKGATGFTSSLFQWWWDQGE